MIAESQRRAVAHATQKLARIVAAEPLVRPAGSDTHGNRLPTAPRESRRVQRARSVLARCEGTVERRREREGGAS